MGKTKIADKKEKKPESGVKAGRVTKATETPKSKSKAVAKSAGKAVEKEVKKSSKKSKKEPTPEPSSSESESEAEADSSDSDSDSEIPDAPAAKAAESSDSDSSDSDSESEEEKPAAKAAPKAAAKAESSDSSDSDSESEAEEKPAAKAAASSDSDSDSDADSDGSSDSSDSDEEAAPSKKRKAEEAAEPIVKKSKTEEAPAAAEGIKNLFVGSLSWNIDEDWLRREFEHFGNIIGCRVISDRETGRSKGFGYVEFDDAAAAAKAQKEMMGYELDGRALNVDFSTPREKPANKTFDRASKFGDKRSAPSNTLFLGNLSFDCSNDVVQEAFQEYGDISRVSLPTDRETGALKGFGYVDFSSTEEATAALEALNGAEIAGRPIRLDYAAARDDSAGGGRGGFGGGRGGRGGFGDRGGRGGGRGGRGGFGDRGGRGGGRGGRGGFGDRGGRGGRGGSSFNRGGFGDFKGSKVSFD